MMTDLLEEQMSFDYFWGSLSAAGSIWSGKCWEDDQEDAVFAYYMGGEL